jgi:capsular polysaccharide biosynthesis protein
MKGWIKKYIIKLINSLNISSEKWGTPKGIIDAEEWCRKNNAIYITILEKTIVSQKPPATIEPVICKIFEQEYNQVQSEVFIAIIDKGRVWGRNGTVITSDDLLISNVSREFGIYKGVYGMLHSIFNRFFLGKTTFINGNIAVISTAGCNNYYHWMIDVLPRIQLLKLAGFFEIIDYFVIDYSELAFQRETLKKIGIEESKIIRSNNQWDFHIKVEKLYVPSLPSVLSTVTKWQSEFLSNSFHKNEVSTTSKKLFISRRKTNGRNLKNEEEIFAYLQKKGFAIYFPEDYSVETSAQVFANATDIVSIHGAANTNWCFCKPATNVLELFPSTQIYPNFWLLANSISLNYTYIIAPGNRLKDNQDPVVNKRNDDFEILLSDIEQVLN